jgi:Retroviral aspartyl protease
MTSYPYTKISDNLAIPAAPILAVLLMHPDATRQRQYRLEAFLDTGSDCTLIPLEAVSILQLPILKTRESITGVGGGNTIGYPCRASLELAESQFKGAMLIACEAQLIGGPHRMILGRDILNQFCVKFDGKRQQFSFEVD